MKKFMDEDFLLSTETAKRLYHDYAEKMPIVDYHCHINPKEIAENKTFDSITEAWLGGDHYKWRAMRLCGYDEELVTGKADPKEKFIAWANTIQRAVGNPLYHWTHLELKRYFGFDGVLSAQNAESVYELCNQKLKQPDMTVRGIIERSGVKVICTTDDPVDSLEYHAKLKADSTFSVKVLPAWRPDKGVNIDKAGFAEYIGKLSAASGIDICCMESLYKAYENRLDFFESMGCKASDHGLDYVVYSPVCPEKLNEILKRALQGEPISQEEADSYKTAMMLFFARQYAKRGWVMQIHYGVLRNNNRKMFKKLGPDTGFDSTGNKSCIAELAAYLDELENEDALPKLILYSINPYDNDCLVSLSGCFPKAGINTRVQHGSGWWFNDTKTGMIQQMTNLANLGILSNFLGMLTDSRSFLSYTRHEYFRRILCDLLGSWVENGEYPNDLETLGKIVQDISYNNAVNFFGFDVK